MLDSLFVVIIVFYVLTGYPDVHPGPLLFFKHLQSLKNDISKSISEEPTWFVHYLF